MARGKVEVEKWSKFEEDLSSATEWFTSVSLSLKTQTVISTLQTSTQDLLDIPPNSCAVALASALAALLSAPSLNLHKPPVAQIVLLILVPALKHDCRVAVTPSSAWLPFYRGCYEHVVGLGEHTHWHACLSAAKGCVKCLYRLFWDRDLDLTL